MAMQGLLRGGDVDAEASFLVGRHLSDYECKAYSKDYHPCDFPSYDDSTDPKCSRTFADVHKDEFVAMSVVYGLLFFATFSVYASRCLRYYRGHQSGAPWNVKQRIHFIGLYGALCLALRAIDLDAWSGRLPYAFYTFLAQQCTAALFTILFVVVRSWMLIMEASRGAVQESTANKALFWGSTILIWLDFTVVAMLEVALAPYPGTYEGNMAAVREMITIFTLAVYGVVAVRTGCQISSALLTNAAQRDRVTSNPAPAKQPLEVAKMYRYIKVTLCCCALGIGYNAYALVGNWNRLGFESPPCNVLAVYLPVVECLQWVCLTFIAFAFTQWASETELHRQQEEQRRMQQHGSVQTTSRMHSSRLPSNRR